MTEVLNDRNHLSEGLIKRRKHMSARSKAGLFQRHVQVNQGRPVSASRTSESRPVVGQQLPGTVALLKIQTAAIIYPHEPKTSSVPINQGPVDGGPVDGGLARPRPRLAGRLG